MGRVECMPVNLQDYDAEKRKCLDKGCCFDQPPDGSGPWCYKNKDDHSPYHMYDDCCDELKCWEQCFTKPEKKEHKETYDKIYQIVMGIRSLYSPCSKPHGTCFSMD